MQCKRSVGAVMALVILFMLQNVSQLAVNEPPKNVTRKVKVYEENGNDSHWEEVA